MKGDPFSGFWTLVPEESKLAGPLPRRWTETLDVGDETISVREEIAGADGRTLTVTVDASFDGRDYSVSGSPLADVIAYTRPGRRRIDGVAKKDGRVVLTESITVSEDGRALTMGYVVRLPDGRDVTSIAVFKRQPYVPYRDDGAGAITTPQGR
jgi:hypothetical protein